MQRVKGFGQVHRDNKQRIAVAMRRPFAAGHLQLLPSTCLRWWMDCLSYGRYYQQIDGPCFSLFLVDGGGGRTRLERSKNGLPIPYSLRGLL